VGEIYPLFNVLIEFIGMATGGTGWDVGCGVTFADRLSPVSFAISIGAPQTAQKRAPSGTVAPHFGQLKS